MRVVKGGEGVVESRESCRELNQLVLRRLASRRGKSKAHGDESLERFESRPRAAGKAAGSQRGLLGRASRVCESSPAVAQTSVGPAEGERQGATTRDESNKARGVDSSLMCESVLRVVRIFSVGPTPSKRLDQLGPVEEGDAPKSFDEQSPRSSSSLSPRYSAQ
jgi:hypothetical protein